MKSLKLQVRPHLLYKPNLNAISVRPDPKATYELFDRVVIARQGYSVPLGTTGTIIGIEPLIDVNPVRQENINAVEYFYVILFDEPIEYGSSIFGIAEKRVFKVRQSVLINISYGTGANREKQEMFRSNNTSRFPNRNGHRNQGPQFQILRKENEQSQQQSYSNVLTAAPPKQVNRNQAARSNGQHIERRVNGQKSNEVPRTLQTNDNRSITSTLATASTAAPQFDANDALRKALGVKTEAPANDTEPPNVAPSSIPIDLAKMFNKSTSIIDEADVKSLPKPPANWQTKATKESKDEFLVSSEPRVVDTNSHPQVQV